MRKFSGRVWLVWSVILGGIPLLTFCSSDNGAGGGDAGAGGSSGTTVYGGSAGLAGASARGGGGAATAGGASAAGGEANSGNGGLDTGGSSGASSGGASGGVAGMAGGETAGAAGTSAGNSGSGGSGGINGGGAAGLGGSSGSNAASGSGGAAGIAGASGASGSGGAGGTAGTSGSGAGGTAGNSGSSGAGGIAGASGTGGGDAGLNLGALHVSSSELDFSYTCGLDESFPVPQSLTVTVSNTGASALTWNVTSDGAAVTPNTSTLAPGAHIDLTVTPKAIGAYQLPQTYVGMSTTPHLFHITNLDFTSTAQSGFVFTPVIAKAVGNILPVPADISFGTVSVGGGPYIRSVDTLARLVASAPFLTYLPPNGPGGSSITSPEIEFHPTSPGNYSSTVKLGGEICVFAPNTFNVSGSAQ